MAQKHILIICGEASGEANAANLATAIKEIYPSIKISATGSSLMKNLGVNVFYDIRNLAAFGFFDVIKKLPEFFSLMNTILEKIEKEKPDVIILVDFSGFNLRLAKKINKSIPVIYYTSPQVWASRLGRIKTIKRFISKMIVLFEFEEKFYREHGIDADFVGHPLLDIVKPAMHREEFLNKFTLSKDKITIALLPGSRKTEVKNILPLMLKTAILINKKLPDTQFIIAKPAQLDWVVYNRIIGGVPLNLKVIEGKTYDCLHAADFALVASGTATMEAAILGKPFFVIYKMGLLNYLLYRPQVKVPFIGMVNIIGRELIVPEFIQFNAKPGIIAEKTLELLNSHEKIRQMADKLKSVKALLGESGAAKRAAKIIAEII